MEIMYVSKSTENIGEIVSFKIHNTIEFLSHSLPISHSLTHTHTHARRLDW